MKTPQNEPKMAILTFLTPLKNWFCADLFPGPSQLCQVVKTLLPLDPWREAPKAAGSCWLEKDAGWLGPLA